MIEVVYIQGNKVYCERINKYRIRDRKVRLNELYNITDVRWLKRFKKWYGLKRFEIISIKEI